MDPHKVKPGTSSEGQALPGPDRDNQPSYSDGASIDTPSVPSQSAGSPSTFHDAPVPPPPRDRRPRPLITAGHLVQAVLALVVISWGLKYLGVLPFRAPQRAQQTITLAPVRAGDLIPQFKIITVVREYAQPVKTRFYMPMPEMKQDSFLGKTADQLFSGVIPGTEEHLIYDMVTTVTAGIDLGKLQEGDIQNDDTHTTIVLPAPEILSIATDQQRSQILWHEKPTLPFAAETAKLVLETQKKGEAEVRRQAQRDVDLMSRARENAERSISQFIGAIRPGRTVAFVYRDVQSTSPLLITHPK